MELSPEGVALVELITKIITSTGNVMVLVSFLSVWFAASCICYNIFMKDSSMGRAAEKARNRNKVVKALFLRLLIFSISVVFWHILFILSLLVLTIDNFAIKVIQGDMEERDADEELEKALFE